VGKVSSSWRIHVMGTARCPPLPPPSLLLLLHSMEHNSLQNFFLTANPDLSLLSATGVSVGALVMPRCMRSASIARTMPLQPLRS
jgi:hypothetical protein